MGIIGKLLCVATDDQYIYAIASETGSENADLVLIRSQAYPLDLASTEWTLLARGANVLLPKSPSTFSNRCAAADGAFMVLGYTYETSGSQYKGMFFDPKTMHGRMEPINTDAICNKRSSCNLHLAGVPGSSPARFNFFYHYATEDAFLMASFNPSSRTIGPVDVVFEQVQPFNETVDPNGPARYIFDYLDSERMAVIKIDNGKSSEHNSMVNTRVFGTDGNGLPVQSRMLSNVTGSLHRPCRNSHFIENQAGVTNGMIYYWCEATKIGMEHYPNAMYSVGENPVRQVIALEKDQAEHSLKWFVPVPTAGTNQGSLANATWAVVVSELGTMSGAQLTGSDAGKYYSSSQPSVLEGEKVEGTEKYSAGAIIGIAVGCVAAAIGLFMLFRRMKNNRQRNGLCDTLTLF